MFTHMRRIGLGRAVAAVGLALALAGCGGSPPSSEVNKAIDNSVRTANTVMFEAGPESAAVTGIELGEWKKDEVNFGQVRLVNYQTTWKATLKFNEPLGLILGEVDGKRIVKQVADSGETIAFTGRVSGTKHDGKWEVNAFADTDLMGPGPWKPLWEKVGGVTMGYRVISNGMEAGFKSRARNFEPLSKLKPYILEGSAEEKQMVAEAQERARKQQEIAAEQARQRQAAIAAQQKQQQEEAAARQKKYEEDQARLRAEAAENQRVAQEEAAAKRKAQEDEARRLAEEQRRTRAAPFLKPLKSPTGAAVIADGGSAMGAVLLTAEVDEQKLTVKGTGIDLREMPFKEFTYEGAVNERNVLTIKPSVGTGTMDFNRASDSGLSGTASGAAATMSALDAGERRKLDDLVALGKRLAGNAESPTVETMDAAAAKTKIASLQTGGFSGTVLYRGRVDARVNGLFGGEPARKPYAWKQENVSIRLPAATPCKGLLVRSGAATDNLVVIVNGSMRARIDALPAGGAAVVTLPAGTQVLDLRLEAVGTASSTGISMIK